MRFVRQLSEEENRELVEALENWDDAEEVRRVRAVRLSSKGWTIHHIAEALDVCRRSVRNWINWYEKDGLEGLKTSYSPGRPSKADQHYRDVLARTAETPPRQMGYPFSRWTLSRLATHMEKKTGVSLNPCHLSVVLKDLGFTYKRPRHDLSHRRDAKLYERKKSELQDLKKGLWTRTMATSYCS
jgi:transposase